MAKMFPVQIKGQPHGFILVEAGATAGGGGNLSDLDDVDITGLADGFILKWDTGTSTWIVAAESGGGGGVTDHGALTGLADDDHTQYHTDARGDARYSLLAHNHTGVYEPAGTAASAIAAHEAAANPHPTYLTAAEGDAAYAPLAHVGTGGGAHANVVAGGASGFMTGADKTKLDGVATGATANVGTVTSVAASVPVGISISGTPITSSGTLAFTWTAGYQGYTTTEASKLAGIAAGATVNSSDATLLARANHTGTQTASTISDFSEAVDDRVGALLVAGTNVTLNYNDVANSLTINASASGGSTNLAYTASPTNGIVTSDTGTDATLSLVDGTNAGLMAPAQHTKLAGIATGATANSSDATLLARANHTGTQAASTISDFNSAARAQTEAELIAGTNITITPASSGATRTLTIAASGGGSDPWTYVKLGSDFVTSSATGVDVTGMSFTPASNQTYEIEGLFMVGTATATVGPRPGIMWPTNSTDGVAEVVVTTSATAVVRAQGGYTSSAELLAPVGGLPNTTTSYPAKMRAMLIAGVSPSGTFKVRFASETGGTNVTMKAGSFIRYRTI